MSGLIVTGSMPIGKGGGGTVPPKIIKPKTIDVNGFYDAASEGADGFNPITVGVSCAKEDGTEWHPFLIRNAQELIEFRNAIIAGNTFSGIHHKVVYDIDLKGIIFNNDFASPNFYHGTLNGNYKKISNFRPDGNRRLISIGATGIVRQLFIENAIIAGPNASGVFIGNGTIEECIITGILQDNSGNYAGTISGFSSLTIRNCITNFEIKSNSVRMGGIVAQIAAGSGGSVTNCLALGNLSQTIGGGYVGGIVGENAVANSVKNCVSAMSSIQTTGNAFRITAMNLTTGINNYALESMLVKGVTVTGTPSDKNGGNATIQQLKSEAFYRNTLGWDMDNMWKIDDGKSFPTLRNFPTQKTAVIEPKIISQNGIYTVPVGVDGFNPVTVNVQSTCPKHEFEWADEIFKNDPDPNKRFILVFNDALPNCNFKPSVDSNSMDNSLGVIGTQTNGANNLYKIVGYEEKFGNMNPIEICVWDFENFMPGELFQQNKNGYKTWALIVYSTDPNVVCNVANIYCSNVLYAYFGNGCVINSMQFGDNISFMFNCSMLQCVNFDDTVKALSNALPNYAFYSCRALKHFTIPDGVVTLGNGALQECNSMETLTIPGGLTSFGAQGYGVLGAAKALQVINIEKGWLIPSTGLSLTASYFLSISALRKFADNLGEHSEGVNLALCYPMKVDLQNFFPDILATFASKNVTIL